MQKRYIKWLEKQSFLYNAKLLARHISGNKIQWQNPYAIPQADSIIKSSSVWFSAYPSSMITSSKQNVLQLLSDDKLWEVFAEIGIRAVHTGPMKQAGGIVKKKYTPSVDGWFDRISVDIDTAFGSETDYLKMVKTAAQYRVVIAGDVIPGHTGKGADFLLALRNYEDYPGIYDLIEINKEDWIFLPEVNNEWESVNLDHGTVNKLKEKGYIPGRLQRVMFSVPETEGKVTGWDVTDKIRGVDGKVRRWVYLHYFKPGLPTMNWLDPSFSAKKIIAGDVIKSIHMLQNKIVRLDATPFLGIEPKSDSVYTWSEGHPLSINSTENIAWLVRRLGGWSFQELNLTLDAIKAFSKYGPDLSYDFVTRPAVQHALLTKDASFLRFMLELMHKYELDPGMLIHGMQNHDEITYELVHFLEHSEDKFNYKNEIITGKELRDKVVGQMHEVAISSKTPYNNLISNGLCTTFTGLVATRLGITDIYNLTRQQQEVIKRGHLLMAMFNAMQPGVFILSGWDLVGALPAPYEEIQHLIADKDYRWINRGAYDLMNYNPKAEASLDGVPKVPVLYGSIIKQLEDPSSFVSQLKHMLDIRKKYKIDLAKQLTIPKVTNNGAILMLHKLPEDLGYEITALNFGDTKVIEELDVNNSKSNNVINLLTNETDSIISSSGTIKIELEALGGKVLYYE